MMLRRVLARSMVPTVLVGALAALTLWSEPDPGDCGGCSEACDLICQSRGSRCTVVNCIVIGDECRCALRCADDSYWHCGQQAE